MGKIARGTIGISRRGQPVNPENEEKREAKDERENPIELSF